MNFDEITKWMQMVNHTVNLHSERLDRLEASLEVPECKAPNEGMTLDDIEVGMAVEAQCEPGEWLPAVVTEFVRDRPPVLVQVNIAFPATIHRDAETVSCLRYLTDELRKVPA